MLFNALLSFTYIFVHALIKKLYPARVSVAQYENVLRIAAGWYWCWG